MASRYTWAEDVEAPLILEREFTHRSLGDSIADALARLIIRGAFQPGERLTEADIATRLETSRAPVREAFKVLAAGGLIELSPRRGAFVAGLDPTDATNLYETRLLLEPAATHTASEHLSPDARSRLQVELDAMSDSLDQELRDQFLEHNNRYHSQLLASCPNPVLRQLIELTWNKSLRYRFFHIHGDPDYMRRSLAIHHLLHEAITEGNGTKAEAVTKKLLLGALQHLLDRFADDRPK